MPVPDLLAAARLGWKEIAEALGVSHDTVRSWASGRREPSSKEQRRLAKLLRQHAHRLLRQADKLEQEAS
jgi:DNA-binding transcriptional regulator YiaG